MLREYWETALWSGSVPVLLTCPKIHEGLVPFALGLFEPGEGVAGLVFTSLQETERENCQGAWGMQLFPALVTAVQ